VVGFTRPPCDAGVIRATPAFPAGLSERRKRLTLAATILGSHAGQCLSLNKAALDAALAVAISILDA
jgi:hypothetical protein